MKTISDYKKEISKIRLNLENKIISNPELLYLRRAGISDNSNYDFILDGINKIAFYIKTLNLLLKEKESNKPWIVRTVSFRTNNYKEIIANENILAYLHDGSGYGHPHDTLRKMFNSNSNDYRNHKPIFELDWKVTINSDGINLSLFRLEIEYLDLKPLPYWKDNFDKDITPNTEHRVWTPLHRIISTPVLGVHFNHAIQFFKQQINKVTASYPLNIVNDFAGNGETIQEA